MIETTETTITYHGDGLVQSFAVDFPVLEKYHLALSTRSGQGKPVALELGRDYDVAIHRDAKNFPRSAEVTLAKPLANDAALTVRRVLPLMQSTSLADNGGYLPDEMEKALDRLTMIAQQIQSQLERAVAAPEDYTPDQITAIILDSVSNLASLNAAVAAINSSLDGKAAKVHGHGMQEVQNLVQTLAEKANAQEVLAALALKSNTGHRHGIADTDQLAAELSARAKSADMQARLAEKADKTDPRLSDSRAPKAHTGSHHMDGPDRIRPEDIGALRPPPGDGKRYFVTATGYDEYIPPASGGPITEHSQLLKRDLPDQHPQSAIQFLVSDLDTIRDDMDELARLIQALTTGKAAVDHGHEMENITGLLDRLAALTTAIGTKANQSALAALAPLSHNHEVAHVNGLTGVLNGKVNTDQMVAATSAKAGLLTPEWLAKILALRAMANIDAPPADGKAYAFRNGGWETVSGGYVAMHTFTVSGQWVAPRTEIIRATVIGGGGSGGKGSSGTQGGAGGVAGGYSEFHNNIYR
ncbi:MAG: hypothetical protein LIP77_08510, partial [Planctomycetes bacterium]|nr:hypothetical protein [Planctomycetota bacterium]